MVEKIIINGKVRALGNIVEEKKADDYLTDHSILSRTTDTVDGTSMNVYSMSKVLLSSELTVTLSNTNVLPGTQVTGTLILTDEEGHTLNGNVRVYLNDSLYTTVTVNDGGGTFNLTLNSEGTYNVKCVYGGENFVTGTTTTKSLTVAKTASTITASDVSKYYTESVTAEATLMINNTVASNKEVTLSIGSRTYTSTTDSNGVATFTIGTGYAAGTHTCTVSYNGTSTVKECSNTFTMTVLQNPTTLTTTRSASTVNPGESMTFTATLKDNNGQGVRNVPVKVYEKGAVIATITTNEAGVGSTTYSSNTEGSHTLTFKFEGDNNYASSTANRTVSVAKDPTRIDGYATVSKLTNDTLTYTARLLRVGVEWMSNATLSFTINNVTTNVQTDSNGYANFTIGNNLTTGTYNLVISYAGTSQIREATKTVRVYVNDVGTVLLMNPTSVTVGTGTVTATLKYDGTGQSSPENYVPLANQTVQFTVNGTTTSRATNSSGIATLDVSNLNAGTYTVTAVFPANNGYARSETSTTLTVTNKQVITINIEDPLYLTPTTADTTTVPVRLTSNNVPVSNKLVHVDGSVISDATTNSNGVAQFQFPTSGTQNYQVYFTVASDNTYESAMKYVDVHVTYTVITGRIVQIVQGVAIIEWTVTHASEPVDNASVVILRPDGTRTTLVTDSDGVVGIDDANVRGDYIASYDGFNCTVTY